MCLSSSMLWGPPKLVVRVMQLTFLSSNFKTWLLVLAIGSFLLSWTAERQLFPHLARILGKVYMLLRPGHRKRRRQYKVLLEDRLIWRQLCQMNPPWTWNGIDTTTELNTNSKLSTNMCFLCQIIGVLVYVCNFEVDEIPVRYRA